MADWDAVLEELRVIRGQLDRLAAVVMQEKAREELLPVWSCGHRHASRGEAYRCIAHRAVVGDAG